MLFDVPLYSNIKIMIKSKYVSALTFFNSDFRSSCAAIKKALILPFIYYCWLLCEKSYDVCCAL